MNISNRHILLILLAVQVLLLILYVVYLKSELLLYTASDPDIIDINYYSSIFNNLQFAILAGIVLNLFVYRYYCSIKKLIFEIPEKRLIVIGISSLLFLQILIALFIDTLPISDSVYYLTHADILFNTGEYRNEFNNTTAFWPIGYPLLIAAIRHITAEYLFSLKIINILMTVLFVVSVYLLFKVYLSELQRKILLILLCLYPNLLFSVNIILTDFIFIALLWFSVYILDNAKNRILFYILIGLILSFAVYLRPVGILIPVIFFLILLPEKRAFQRRVILVIFIILLMPWIIRNYNTFNTFVPVSTNGGFNFLMGNHENSKGKINFNFQYDMSNPNESDESLNAYGKGIKDLFHEPGNLPGLIVGKLFYSYWRDDSSVTWTMKSTNTELSGILLASVFYLANMYFYFILLFNIVYFVGRNRINLSVRLKRIIIYLSVYFVLIILIYVGNERYHLPLIPIHMYLAVAGLTSTDKESFKQAESKY